MASASMLYRCSLSKRLMVRPLPANRRVVQSERIPRLYMENTSNDLSEKRGCFKYSHFIARSLTFILSN